jgi:tetratricopeptide (TPR) repeat protein
MKIAHYSFGFKGLLAKKRAGTTDVWKELRKLTYFGLCDCERKLNRFQYAIAFCQKSLSFDPQDEFTHYVLALAYAGQANATGDIGLLPAARKHFSRMIELNGELQEAEYAKANIKNIDALLKAQ